MRNRQIWLRHRGMLHAHMRQSRPKAYPTFIILLETKGYIKHVYIIVLYYTEVSNKLIFSQFSVNRWKVTLLNLQVYSVIPTFIYYLLLKVKDKTVKKFELQAVLTCLFCCCAQVRRTAQVVLQVSKVPIHLTHSVLQTAENQNEDDSF